MKEVVTMWKYTRMIILVALSAAIYAAFLLVFKAGIPIIPGITEVRPGNVFPVFFGLLFGPAGAWGSAIGNFIGDWFGGTLGWGSIAGFVGNFFLGFIPYKMWGSLFGLVTQKDISQNTNSLRKFVAYAIAAFTAAVACAIIIAWYLDLAGIVPFAVLSFVITFNNFIVELILGPILLLLLYPRIKKWGLVWTDIMDKNDVSAGFGRQLGSILMIVGAVGGLIIGWGLSTGLYGQSLMNFGAGTKSQIGVWLGVAPFIILIFLASFMLSGQEQFVEEE